MTLTEIIDVLTSKEPQLGPLQSFCVFKNGRAHALFVLGNYIFDWRELSAWTVAEFETEMTGRMAREATKRSDEMTKFQTVR